MVKNPRVSMDNIWGKQTVNNLRCGLNPANFTNLFLFFGCWRSTAPSLVYRHHLFPKVFEDFDCGTLRFFASFITRLLKIFDHSGIFLSAFGCFCILIYILAINLLYVNNKNHNKNHICISMSFEVLKNLTVGITSFFRFYSSILSIYCRTRDYSAHELHLSGLFPL